MTKTNSWNKPYREIFSPNGEVLHVYASMEDALMHEQDYLYAGWHLTGWDDNPNKNSPFLDNAWAFKLIQPKVGGNGYAK